MRLLKFLFLHFLLAPFAALSQANTWIPVADFAGQARIHPVSFSINNEGYVGLAAGLNDLWRFNPNTNSWSQCANFTGTDRWGASAFVIGTKAYVGNGSDSLGDRNDFFRYDASANQWTTIASFPGTPRTGCIAFTIGNRGYVGAGRAWFGSNFFADMWQYMPATDSWSAIAPFPVPRVGCACFAIGSCGFAAGGGDSTGSFNELWKYDSALNAWFACADVPWPSGEAFAFAINGQGYYGCGSDGNVLTNAVAKYNPVTDNWSWLPGAGYPGFYVYGAAAFVCNDTAYVGLGSTFTNDFWKFYPSPDVGIQEHLTAQTLLGYPNPANENITILLNDLQSDRPITIRTFDPQGKLVRNESSQVSNQSVWYQRNNLSAGNYILELSSNGEIIGHSRIVFR